VDIVIAQSCKAGDGVEVIGIVALFAQFLQLFDGFGRFFLIVVVDSGVKLGFQLGVIGKGVANEFAVGFLIDLLFAKDLPAGTAGELCNGGNKAYQQDQILYKTSDFKVFCYKNIIDQKSG
jgi:hypothetical protein